MDIRLNKDFDVELDERNDLPTITGREKFEQRVRIVITELLQDLVGEMKPDITLNMINTKVEEVAQEFDIINSVVNTSAKYDKDKPNVINLKIVYDTDEDFQTFIFE